MLSLAPVLYWRLGEVTGTNAVDLAPGGNDGTYTGGMVLGADGALARDSARAATFDGAGDYVAIANPGDVLDGKFISVVAWAKPLVAGTNYPRFIDRVYNGQFAFYWFDAAGEHYGKLGVSLKNSVGGTYDDYRPFSVVVDVGVWQQVGFTWDGTDVRVYHNGSEAGNDSFAGTGLVTSTNVIRIGQRADNTNRDYEGDMMEVAVFDKVLAAADYEALYLIGKNGP